MHSDQMEYLHKCTHCGYWNLLSYDDYNGTTSGGNIKMINPNGVNKLALTVQPGTFEFVCKKCGQPLDRWYNGAWVQRYPDRTQGLNGIRGYHISQMNAVWVNLK